jgi:hypothetical protein
MNDDPDLVVALHDLVVQHGLLTVLQTVARLMGDTSNVTGGILSEVAAIEEWLAAQYGPLD